MHTQVRQKGRIVSAVSLSVHYRGYFGCGCDLFREWVGWGGLGGREAVSGDSELKYTDEVSIG